MSVSKWLNSLRVHCYGNGGVAAAMVVFRRQIFDMVMSTSGCDVLSVEYNLLTRTNRRHRRIEQVAVGRYDDIDVLMTMRGNTQYTDD